MPDPRLSTTHLTPNLCIIGAGSAGLSVAAGAVQMGVSVVLVEGAKMGGDCLNYGCIPSKALIAVGKRAHSMTRGGPYGIAPTTPIVDYPAANDYVRSVIAAIEPHDSQERFEKLGVTVIREFARFISPREVQAGDIRIKARRFVIATGSSPAIPPIEGLSEIPFETNETLFALRDKPEKLLIIGGGPIGMEMAQAHQRLGCQVTVLAGEILGKDDPELTQIAIAQVRDEGVVLVSGVKATRVNGHAGEIHVTCDNGLTYSGTHLLVAVGRKVNVEALDLQVAGIDTSSHGICVNSRLKTSNRRVYAIGDVNGGLQFTHVAGYQAGIVIRSALFGLPAKASTRHLPWTTYLDPEIAQVGMTEAVARKAHGDRLTVVRASYQDNDRAQAEGESTGLLKVMVVRGRPIGASMVGAQAGELIQIWALAIASKLKMSAVAGMVAPYPTLGEVNKRAASEYFKPTLFQSPWIRRIVRLVQKF